jgi:hypothetical protein
MNEWFHADWCMKHHVFSNSFRIASLQFKKEIIQLFWIMKEFSKSTNKILVAFAKFFHYPNDKTCKGPRQKK